MRTDALQLRLKSFIYSFFVVDFSLQEASYIPLVREMLTLQKAYEKPQAAANAIAKQLNRATSKAKAKAKA